MMRSPLSASKQKALTVVDKMQLMGFPNKKNIAVLLALAEELKKHAPGLNRIHKISIKQIQQILQEMNETLEQRKVVTVRTYTYLNAELVILRDLLSWE